MASSEPRCGLIQAEADRATLEQLEDQPLEHDHPVAGTDHEGMVGGERGRDPGDTLATRRFSNSHHSGLPSNLNASMLGA